MKWPDAHPDWYGGTVALVKPVNAHCGRIRVLRGHETSLYPVPFPDDTAETSAILREVWLAWSREKKQQNT